YKESIDYLLKNGADLNSLDGYYGSALHGASAFGDTGIVSALIGKGADVNAVGGRFGNALQAACARGCQRPAPLVQRRRGEVHWEKRHTSQCVPQAIG
ncbi:hypothetical protein C8J57DRAFT_1091779, partial [Mycena rebaudengoi]